MRAGPSGQACGHEQARVWKGGLGVGGTARAWTSTAMTVGWWVLWAGLQDAGRLQRRYRLALNTRFQRDNAVQVPARPAAAAWIRDGMRRKDWG
jgi:hypothetical protein